MSVLMKKRPIKTKRQMTRRSVGSNSSNMMFIITCPTSNAVRVKHYLEKNGCEFVEDNQELADAKELFAKRIPANMLIGARGKENVSQIQLSELTGIPRRHISDMENGRRPIGKQNAAKLGKALNIDYRMFL